MKKVVVLVSGGMDSVTALYHAKSDLDVVADSESLQEWHAFVAEQTGITLRLEI